jgi:hypothetical protein
MCAETVDADAFRERLAEQLDGIRALALSVEAVLNALREPAAESVAMGEIAAEQNFRSRSAWEAPVADTHGCRLARLVLRARAAGAADSLDALGPRRVPAVASPPIGEEELCAHAHNCS